MSKISAIMYGQKVRKVMYKYEIWFEGQCIIDSDNVDTEFESEEEAMEEALEVAEDRIQEWKADGSWDGEKLDDFDIRVKEV